MTATPIPRSLALTAYGDLDLSLIDELPPGRAGIATKLLVGRARDEAFARARVEIAAGRQVFVICPLVDGSERVASRAATEEAERLRNEQFPELAERIELLHGRMPARDKEAAMQRFVRGEAALLVSTAVVEVGIDVPNATVMIIESADRFARPAAPVPRPRRPRRGPVVLLPALRRAGHAVGRLSRRAQPQRLRSRAGRPRAARPGRRVRAAPVRPAAVARLRPARRPAGSSPRGRGRSRARPR